VTGCHRARSGSHRHHCCDHIGCRGNPRIAHPERNAGREIVEIRDRPRSAPPKARARSTIRRARATRDYSERDSPPASQPTLRTAIRTRAQ
jgi:hypothetical protein